MLPMRTGAGCHDAREGHRSLMRYARRCLEIPRGCPSAALPQVGPWQEPPGGRAGLRPSPRTGPERGGSTGRQGVRLGGRRRCEILPEAWSSSPKYRIATGPRWL